MASPSICDEERGLAHALHLWAHLITVPGEAMKRPIARLAAATLAALAVVAALAALVIVASAGARLFPTGVGWAVPLIAGGGVGLLSWFLLAGTGRDDEFDVKRATVRCASCGTEVLEDWRLCPYCGESNDPASRDAAAARVSP